jgi:hypothetical protein
MRPEINQPESVIAPLQKVTPISKYLAMALFVILPFVGGYVGYTFAPEKIVVIETAPVTIDSQKDTIMPSFSELQRIFLEQVSDGYTIEPLYTTKESKIQYFKSFIQDSSACCGIYKYLPETKSFHNTGIGIDSMIGEKESVGGRYVAKVISGVILEVYDLETQSLEESFRVVGSETLISSTCGYAGYSHDLKWIDKDTLEYGVYTLPSTDAEEACPEMELIEYRTLKME